MNVDDETVTRVRRLLNDAERQREMKASCRGNARLATNRNTYYNLTPYKM